MKKKHALATRVIHAGQSPDPSTGAVMTPIYATSTYVQESPGRHKGYDYARSINPTRSAYERCVADLESGTRGWAFASGLAAMSTALETIDSGSHVLVSDDLYGGTYRLFEKVRRRSANLDFTFIDMTDAAKIESAFKPNTRMVWVETPSNPLLKLIDLEAVAKIARKHNAISVSDNTFASPWIQRPIELGFDMVIHSATKYLNGHSDMVGGVAVVGENKELGDQMQFLQNSVGAIAGPFDSFLAMRGLKTLALRMERHCENALELARWLEKEPKVRKVNYPGLTSHPQHDLAQAPDGRPLWRHGDGDPRHRSRRHPAFPRKHASLLACGKPRRSREPGELSADHDPRRDSGRAAHCARHHRVARQALGRSGRRGRPARRPEDRASPRSERVISCLSSRVRSTVTTTRQGERPGFKRRGTFQLQSASLENPKPFTCIG